MASSGALFDRQHVCSRARSHKSRLVIPSSLRKKQFRPKFEVHRIEVVPLPTPNEAVFFEDRDDLLRHAVAIKDAAAMRAPVPIIREGGIEIDRDAVAVRARLAS